MIFGSFLVKIVIFQNSSTIKHKDSPISEPYPKVHKFVTFHFWKICIYNKRNSCFMLILKVTFFRLILHIGIICQNSNKTETEIAGIWPETLQIRNGTFFSEHVLSFKHVETKPDLLSTKQRRVCMVQQSI